MAPEVRTRIETGLRHYRDQGSDWQTAIERTVHTLAQAFGGGDVGAYFTFDPVVREVAASMRTT